MDWSISLCINGINGSKLLIVHQWINRLINQLLHLESMNWCISYKHKKCTIRSSRKNVQRFFHSAGNMDDPDVNIYIYIILIIVRKKNKILPRIIFLFSSHTSCIEQIYSSSNRKGRGGGRGVKNNSFTQKDNWKSNLTIWLLKSFKQSFTEHTRLNMSGW